MQDFGTKADNSPPPGGQLSAAEFNNLATENENAVLRSGQALSGAASDQLAQSLFLHGVKSESFQDSGAANAYVATPVSGASGVLLPATFAAMNGAVISIKASNTNTGASTLNIGQTTGALIGSKAIRTQGDLPLTAGMIQAGSYIQLIYNSAFDTGAGAWEVMPWTRPGKLQRVLRYSRIGGVQNVSINGAADTTTGASAYIPAQGMNFIMVDAVGGGGAGGGAVNPTAGNTALGAPGSSGSFGRAIFTAAQIGATQTVNIGAGGVGNSATTGGSGTATSMGALLTCPGGGGGLSSGVGGVAVPSLLGQTSATGAPTGANVISTTGAPGGPSISMAATAVASYGGQGGGNPLGTPTNFAGANTSGIAATSYGAGGSGVAVLSGSGPATGPNGAAGVLIIWEYA